MKVRCVSLNTLLGFRYGRGFGKVLTVVGTLGGLPYYRPNSITGYLTLPRLLVTFIN